MEIAKDSRFASQIITIDYNVGYTSCIYLYFCDISEMVTYLEKLKGELSGNSGRKISMVWVKTSDKKWDMAYGSTYVSGSGIDTPMNSGIVAFWNHSDAKKFRKDNGGKIATFNELRDYLVSGQNSK